MKRRDFIKFSGLTVPSLALVGVVDNDSFSTVPSWEEITRRVNEFTIQWRGYDISNHPALIPNSNFTYSPELFNFQVAQAWGILPSELAKASYQDKVNTYAWYVAMKQIERVEAYELARKTKRK